MCVVGLESERDEVTFFEGRQQHCEDVEEDVEKDVDEDVKEDVEELAKIEEKNRSRMETGCRRQRQGGRRAGSLGCVRVFILPGSQSLVFITCRMYCHQSSRQSGG